MKLTKMVDGVVTPLTPEEEMDFLERERQHEEELALRIKNAYKEKRAAEYPPIKDQLDMIYWDKINNTDVWVNLILSIKEKYPKSIDNEGK